VLATLHVADTYILYQVLGESTDGANLVESVAYSRPDAQGQAPPLIAPLDLFQDFMSLRTFTFAFPSPISEGMETIACLVKPFTVQLPEMISSIVGRVFEEGLCISGARLVYLDADDWADILLDRKVRYLLLLRRCLLICLL